MSINKEVIASIRKTFLANAKGNSDAYHPSDVQRVETQDWPIERYVLTTKSEDKALKGLDKAMQWRMTYGVNDFTDDYFPEEIYKIGLLSQFCKDKEGRPVLWYQLKSFHKSAELDQLIRQFTVYQFDKLDRQTTHGGWAMISDATDAGLSNMEMDFSKFMVTVLQSYYPRGPKYLASVDLPWILNATSKLVVAFMNEELKNCVKFINNQELLEYLDSAVIPVHLKGSYAKDLVNIPPGVKPLELLSHTKFNGDQIKKVYSTFKSALNQ